MSRPKSQRSLARRAMYEDRSRAFRFSTGLRNVGVSALAISVLGVGVAGTAISTSSAESMGFAPAISTTQMITVTPDGQTPTVFQRDTATVSRSSFRAALTDVRSDDLAADAVTESAGTEVADEQTVAARAAELRKESAAAAKRDHKLKEKRAKAKKRAEAKRRAQGTPTMPLRSYRVAAGFGATGSWARYHTGFDFSAPVGTTIYAPTAGVVTNAGSGPASGWAGTYVVVKHADGNQTLYAHMGSVSVRVGQRVTGGTTLGKVGMTGRTFGAHLHFELYPAGVEPGDVYRAINPQPWLAKLGLKP